MNPSLTIAAGVLGVLLSAQALGADEYAVLLKTRRYAEAERLANLRLAQDPANADALVAKSEAILDGGGAASRMEEAVNLGERCVAAHPRVSNCHLALGNALGSKAVSAGIMASLGAAGTIRDAFRRAIELDPQNMDARFSLLEFYLQAPAIVGGGSARARALASQTAAVNAEAGKLMLARLDADDDKPAQAEAALLAMATSSNEALADAQRDLLLELGKKYLKEKKYADSERLYREAQKRFPDSDGALYGLARLQQERGKHREAVAAMEQVIVMNPRPSAYYRIGQSQQALGEKAKAMAAYEKALSFKAGMSKAMKADTEDQLKVLKNRS